MTEAGDNQPGKAVVRKEPPYPERTFTITPQRYKAAYLMALGMPTKDIAEQCETTPQTIRNFKTHPVFKTLVADLLASAEFDPSLELKMHLRLITEVANRAIEALNDQLSEKLVLDDGEVTNFPNPDIRNKAALGLLTHLGKLMAAQAVAVSGGGGGDTNVYIDINPLAVPPSGGIIEGKRAKEEK